ncbi:hypothetical protein BGX26_006474 [Mortierella sp. AD094]|nr:hypothetical protein BGX26_006474 [Mortierella sp. AD094]
MKLSLFHYLAILACILAVMCVQVNAEDPPPPSSDTPGTTGDDPQQGVDECIWDFDDDKFFCQDSDEQLMQIIDDIIAEAEKESTPDGDELGGQDQGAPGPSGMTTAARRRALYRRGIVGDVKNYFETYWKALKLIFKGEFAEGIFMQMKNSGSWCDSDKWIVKVIKKAIDKLSSGAITGICDCLYPMVKGYDTFNDLKNNVDTDGLSTVLQKCSQTMRKQIVGSLKKTGRKA